MQNAIVINDEKNSKNILYYILSNTVECSHLKYVTQNKPKKQVNNTANK